METRGEFLNFDEGLRRTIDWYQTHSTWLENARSGEYLNYYDRHYVNRAKTFN
jgi:dTDP-glucose 4,6-dehydratase